MSNEASILLADSVRSFDEGLGFEHFMPGSDGSLDHGGAHARRADGGLHNEE